LQQWRVDDRLDGFDWRRNGKLVTFRNAEAFEHARGKVTDILQQQVLALDCARWNRLWQAAEGFVGGIYTPNEEVADCHAFCQRLAARLEASGRCTFCWGAKLPGCHADGAVQAIEMGDRCDAGRPTGAGCRSSQRRVGLAWLVAAAIPAQGLQPQCADRRSTRHRT
jgi:D-amino-acid dehydrogenase